jgi:hypothetical protein
MEGFNGYPTEVNGYPTEGVKKRFSGDFFDFWGENMPEMVIF